VNDEFVPAEAENVAAQPATRTKKPAYVSEKRTINTNTAQITTLFSSNHTLAHLDIKTR
jgi:hypothetical protein